ncbi:MAG: PadR family transcriptional regulator [Actinomycetota bacterium]
MSSDDVPANWLRGVLEPCLLALLADGETYGYELAARLESGGIGPVKGGSLYPALGRLEQDGRVVAEWRPGDGGPGRKYYRLTDAGRASVADNARRWRTFSSAVSEMLDAGVRS